jgi:capsular exopolysaccharide synthesis family protein
VSRYFDICQKIPDDLDNALSAASVEGMAAENVAKASELPETPVEQVRLRPESRLVYHTDPRSPAADRFRFLRMRLRQLWNIGKLRSLLITSPLPGDGKSTIALNLATAVAERGRRAVLLVEADLHQPSLAQYLGLETGPGLAECLEDGLNPMSAIRRLDPLGWYFLSSGTPRSNPTELLQSEALAGHVQELSTHFEWILIDSPPVTPLTDALSLAAQTDGTLLVARAGRTAREAIEETLKLLGPERVLGVLLNGIVGLNRLYSKYSQYYGTKAVRIGGSSELPKVIQPKKPNAELRGC